MPVAEMNESRKAELIEKVGRAVGLLVNFAAIDRDPASGQSWIKEDWICRFRPPRVWPGTLIDVGGGFEEPPQSTGVLFRSQDGAHVATSAHSIAVEKRWRDQVRLVVGLDHVRQRVPSTQVVEIGGLEHYEDMDDRDLAIMVGRADETVPGLSLAPPALVITPGDPVYVVGHAGGRDIAVFAGTVKSRMPEAADAPLRSLNVDLKGGHPCLSGSPAFVWRAGGEPILVGVVQGKKEVQAREKRRAKLLARVLELTQHDERAATRLLGRIAQGSFRAELAALDGELNAVVEHPPRLEGWRDWVMGVGGASKIARALDVSAFKAHVLDALASELSEPQARRLVDAMVKSASDDCSGDPEDGVYNIAFLGGNMSTFFFGEHRSPSA